MKKLATLLLAAGLVFGAATGASAIDFKAKGQWIMAFDYGDGRGGVSDGAGGGNTVYGYGGEDNFEAEQRVRLQLQAIASETLSGTVYFEMGETTWGRANAANGNPMGGALGADGMIIELKHAYIDWVVPSTELKVRMGIQAVSLPSFTADTQVFSNDVAGIVLSNKFNDNFALTGFWIRPLNDNFAGSTGWGGFAENSSGFMDNVDAFGLILPMTFDGFKVVPWLTYTTAGKNIFNRGATGALPLPTGTGGLSGLLPAGAVGDLAVAAQFNDISSYGNVWHLGVTGEVTMADPFRIAWDLNYGHSDFGSYRDAIDNRSVDVKRSGFYGSLLAEYKMEWGTPGLYFWYSTGDDGNARNGSERMPVISLTGGTNQFSNFASSGSLISRENVIGGSLIGTWGIGARLKDFSFVEDLSHTFRINYFGGTNSAGLVEDDLTITQPGSFGSENALYLTHKDWALEFGLHTKYQIYENLNLFFDANYLVLDFNRDVWGKDYTATDAWNINASFVYSF